MFFVDHQRGKKRLRKKKVDQVTFVEQSPWGLQGLPNEIWIEIVSQLGQWESWLLRRLNRTFYFWVWNRQEYFVEGQTAPPVVLTEILKLAPNLTSLTCCIYQSPDTLPSNLKHLHLRSFSPKSLQQRASQEKFLKSFETLTQLHALEISCLEGEQNLSPEDIHWMDLFKLNNLTVLSLRNIINCNTFISSLREFTQLVSLDIRHNQIFLEIQTIRKLAPLTVCFLLNKHVNLLVSIFF